MATTDQPPDEAEGSSGSGYAAENIRASPQHQTAEVRGTIWCSVDFFFLMHTHPCNILRVYNMQNHTAVWTTVPVAPHLMALTP